MKNLPNLTPLRFFLALIVLIFHLPQLSRNQGLPYFNNSPIFNKGTEAVYMFFVLSGFLIIRLIYNAKVSKNFSIRNFYMRRALRILPLYYLIVIFGFIFYNVILPFLKIPFEINYDLKTGILMTFLFIPNVFATYEPGGIIEILWSIGIEEQFYLIIAPFIFLLNKKKLLNALILIFLIYFIVYHNDNFAYLKKYNFVYFFMLSGGIISILNEKKKLDFLKKTKITTIVISLITFLFFTTNLFLFKSSFLYNLFICALFSLFIFSISTGPIDIKNKTLNYLGKISYGIYMYHAIVLNFVVFIFLKIQKTNTLSDLSIIILINISTICLTILTSHFSYKYFESYFLKLKNNYKLNNKD
ncbi:acyltransferase family protein [Thalassobellus citreus]|uniref:acyltransferase family protein n=1 Tax=Thalassobellus citreus TaxID=3367752 RepID=UPI0037B9A7DB